MDIKNINLGSLPLMANEKVVNGDNNIRYEVNLVNAKQYIQKKENVGSAKYVFSIIGSETKSEMVLTVENQAHITHFTPKLVISCVKLIVNGPMSTPYEYQDMLDSLEEMSKHGLFYYNPNKCFCEDCKKDFSGNVAALAKHIEETHHSDSILQMFPFWASRVIGL